jgi:hypothetical protein
MLAVLKWFIPRLVFNRIAVTLSLFQCPFSRKGQTCAAPWTLKQVQGDEA